MSASGAIRCNLAGAQGSCQLSTAMTTHMYVAGSLPVHVWRPERCTFKKSAVQNTCSLGITCTCESSAVWGHAQGLRAVASLLRASASNWWRGCKLSALEICADGRQLPLHPVSAAPQDMVAAVEVAAPPVSCQLAQTPGVAAVAPAPAPASTATSGAAVPGSDVQPNQPRKPADEASVASHPKLSFTHNAHAVAVPPLGLGLQQPHSTCYGDAMMAQRHESQRQQVPAGDYASRLLEKFSKLSIMYSDLEQASCLLAALTLHVYVM